MAKDPIFPLYYNDIDRSTKTWTDEEFGAYMRLLMEQWDKGGLPKDYQRLTRIATSLDTNWPMLKDKFVEVDGQLKNLVLEEIREKKRIHKEKQRENVLKRYQKPTKHITKHIPLESEIEIEKENDIDNTLNSALNEIYLDQQKPKWGHIDFDFEVNTFKEKVRGSPEHYRNHDSSGLKLAFQSQLRNAKKKHNGRDKQTDNLAANIQAFNDRWADKV
jgi:uncharacterized protein YdaU (DUF1376 family)